MTVSQDAKHIGDPATEPILIRSAPPQINPPSPPRSGRPLRGLLESLRTKGAIKDIDVAHLLGTQPETVSRWSEGRAFPRANTEKTLLELEYIIDQLAEFYDPNEARQWIFVPQKLLGGTSPAELISTGRLDEVMRLVGKLRDMIYL